jgi:hypothetical protein
MLRLTVLTMAARIFQVISAVDMAASKISPTSCGDTLRNLFRNHDREVNGICYAKSLAKIIVLPLGSSAKFGGLFRVRFLALFQVRVVRCDSSRATRKVRSYSC